MLELNEAHHQVLYLAVDEANLQALMSRVYGHIGDREVTVLEPLDPETARAAALDLLSAGHINVFYRAALAGKDSQGDRYLPPDEAQALLNDPVTWDRDDEEGILRAWTHELHLTTSGREAFDEAHRRLGGRLDSIDREHREEMARVERDHPNFFEKQEQYFRDIVEWTETGRGPMPEPPKWPSPDGDD